MKRLVLIALLLIPGLSWASRLQESSGSCDNATACSQTFASPTASGNLIVVIVLSFYNEVANAPQAFSVTDNKGNSSCYVKDVNDGSPDAGKYEIWHCENITGGSSHQVTVNSTAGAYYGLIVFEYSGMATASAFDIGSVNQQAAPATTYTSNSASTSNANDVLVGAEMTFANAAWTPDSPWNSIETNHGTFFGWNVVDRTVSATGSYANTGSVSGDSNKTTAMFAAYKTSGGGGGGATATSGNMPMMGL